MTAKEYLDQARGMQMRLDALAERRQRYEELAQSCTAKYRQGPGATTRRASSVEEYAVKMADLSREMKARADIYADALRKIEAAIDAVEPARYRDVLKLRYLNVWTWQRIADAMYYSLPGVLQVHRRALLRVRVPRDAEPVEDTVRRAIRGRIADGQ